MPAQWDGNKMVISHQYIIEKPYGANNVKLVDDKSGKQGLDRIRRIVDMERQKIALKMGGDVTGGSLGAKGPGKGSREKGG